MQRLLNIGFIPVGNWELQDNEITYILNNNHSTTNVLYSFVSNGEIKYIGKTILQLSQRMYGYQNPGPTQTTNIRVNRKIKELLVNEQPVDIFILIDNGLLKYGSYRINLAAALEDTLIFEINAEWNLRGRNIEADLESEKAELTKEPKQTNELIPVKTKFEILLGSTYFNQGFFNISKEYSNLFGSDNANIDIHIDESIDKPLKGYINRTANKNGTPRIMGGKELKSWINENHKLNDLLQIEIISPVAIKLK